MADLAGTKRAFSSYLGSLRETYVEEKTEHTDRDAIKRLLQYFTPGGITIVPEPKRIAGVGAPDFKVRQNGQIIGYVEAKPLGTTLEELKKVLKSDQITRYRSISKNIIVTDYLNWIWLKDGSVQTGTLCDVEKIENRKSVLESTETAKIQSLLSGFLSVSPQKIDRAIDLADALATRTRLLRDFLGLELIRQERTSQGERLFGLYLAFKKQVSDGITLPEFADAFAQTLSYGLFLSKLNANGYAVLHSQTYRDRYGEFLRREFPRIPFPDKCRSFYNLARLGWELAQIHLLRDVPSLGLAKYVGIGSHEVDQLRYVEQERSIYINKIQKFTPIPPEVWNFHVGGYPVLEKYLKSRKGRTLTLGEINNVTNVANVLAFTIEQMRKIDEAYQAAF